MTTRRTKPLSITAITLLALAAGCKSTSPPTAFGVNITVDASALTPDQRSKATVGSVQTTGAEAEAQTFSIASAIGSGQVRFHYVPKVTSGTLTFHFDAIDTTGQVYGSGSSQPVTLGSAAVSTTITLAAATGAGKGDGAPCTTDTQCLHGHCTDGVCCNEACHDVCASCAQPHAVGLCTAYAAGTDPDRECMGFTATGSGGSGGSGGNAGAGGKGGAGGGTTVADAGTHADGGGSDAEAINPPDGGIVAMATKCGGTCNGARACAFAEKGTVCGTAFCNNHRELANIACDGQGTCGFALEACSGGYGCNPTASPATCRTSCAIDAECQTSGYYCAGGQCTPQKTDGKTCTSDDECGSGHCASGVCCKTTCAAPNSCNSTGSAGTCQCPGMPCKTGVSCALFYPDVDVDGFGDKMATGTAGCADSPPSGFVADNTDCDDHDANVFPGQTAYFSTTSKGVGTFDYNCDGMQEKGVAEYPGASCTFCPSACGAGCTAASASTCASANAQASLSCGREGGICPILINPTPVQSGVEAALPVSSSASTIIIQLSACCGCNDHAGFTTAVGCGQTGNYVTCGTCGAASGSVGSGTATSSAAKIQTCH